MQDIHPPEELERLALAELRLAAAAGDAQARRTHLDMAAVYATRAEQARLGRATPPG